MSVKEKTENKLNFMGFGQNVGQMRQVSDALSAILGHVYDAVCYEKGQSVTQNQHTSHRRSS